MSFRITTVAASLTALGLFAAPVLADTFTVSPQGALPTIQAGIDAAGPGDTVKVSAGYYLENVSIPADKDGLRLQGKGQVVLDAHPSTGEGSGPGLFIEADDVTVQGLIIRNAAAGNGMSGHGILTLGHGLTVLKSRIERCSANGVRSDSVDGLRVIGSSFSGCGSTAVFADGHETLVEGCRIERCGAGVESYGVNPRVVSTTIEHVAVFGIELEGDGAVVARNTLRHSDGHGIRVTGAKVHVERNNVFGTAGRAIDLMGPGSFVEKNRIELAGGEGVNAQGAELTISGNRVTGVQGRGIHSEGQLALIERNTLTSCGLDAIDHTGSAMTITRNTVRGVFAAGHGIDVAGADGGTVSDNRVADATRCGIRVGDGSQLVQVIDNAIDGAGSQTGDGIQVEGYGHVVSGNLIREAVRDGINAEGDDLLIADNRIGRCGEDGIDLESGSGNTIDGNQVNDCHAEGIENNAADTTLTDNKAKGNRTDFADDGSLALMSGNQSGDDTALEPGKTAIDS